MPLEMCHLLFGLKKISENALRIVTDVVLNILLCQPISLAWTDPLCWKCKYKLTGFRINFFKNDFSVHYFVCLFITVGQSTVARQQHKHHFIADFHIVKGWKRVLSLPDKFAQHFVQIL